MVAEDFMMSAQPLRMRRDYGEVEPKKTLCEDQYCKRINRHAVVRELVAVARFLSSAK